MDSITLRRCTLAFALALVIPGSEMFGQTWPDADSVAAMIKERVASRRAVGIVVASLEKGKSPRYYIAGVAGSAVPLDSNTVFEIGSVTKVFTTAVLAEMVQRGEVRLDDPIAKYQGGANLPGKRVQ